MRCRSWWLALAMAAAVAGCAKQPSGESAATAADAGPAKAEGPRAANPLQVMLAYEHRAVVELSADRIAAQATAVQKACNNGKFGACVVLGVTQQGGDSPEAQIEMRAVPEAIEPLVTMAGVGGELGSRSTQAQDLAQAITDNRLTEQRLRNEHTRLLELQARPGIKIEDLMSLSERMAQLEAQLAATTQEGAQHQRRIQTQKLTIVLTMPGSQQGGSVIGEAIDDFAEIFATVVAVLIRVLAGVLPIAVVGIGGLWLFKLWRRRRGRNTANKAGPTP
ncbi:DUF4349 domain-containing protein [Montanilutibacter psychrotolerans]|uniref:DUF4349 domain-containing protein n=1 Tax=Montanilutibacter psychrotolerans TaxID=1327343 RepID=A0A3M8STS4_9GAMM|nr:DUF4349 domain-containing protein [Lysobacter psychrotolerans]RNF82634.1 DUF4349 domain-containing protein [Lysobacter psychrotolerans]